MKNKIIVFCLVLINVGCASYKPAIEKKVENGKTFFIPFDKAWSKVVAFASSNGMNVKTIEKASGLISFERAYDRQFVLTYYDCGRYASMSEPTKKSDTKEQTANNDAKSESDSNMGPVTDAILSMNFFLEKIGEKETKIKINMFGKVTIPGVMNLYGTPATPTTYPCYSKGVFEQEIFSVLQK